MMTVDLLEKEILALPEEERFKLLERLSGKVYNNSEQEAMQREKAWDQDPSLGMDLDELKKAVGRG